MPAGVRKIPTAMTSPTIRAMAVRRPIWRLRFGCDGAGFIFPDDNQYHLAAETVRKLRNPTQGGRGSSPTVKEGSDWRRLDHHKKLGSRSLLQVTIISSLMSSEAGIGVC